MAGAPLHNNESGTGNVCHTPPPSARHLGHGERQRDGDREGMRGNNEGSHLEGNMKEDRRGREKKERTGGVCVHSLVSKQQPLML